MNKFSIRDIEMLSGIKAHTFRIWEQRHGLCFCKRKDSQHRYYDNEDLKAVLRIAYLYHRGYKISRIANLSEDDILELTTVNMDAQNCDVSIQQLVEAALDYDQLRFEKILQHAILRFGFEKSILQVFYPFLEKTGLLWVTGHLVPAQEHFSTGLIQQKIMVAIDRLGAVRTDQEDTILIFAPPGEMHEIPLLVALYHFKKHGFKTIYFGVNAPLPQLEYYCIHRKISHLFLHSLTNFSNKESGDYVQCLLHKFPGVKIIASGPVFKNTQLNSPLVKIANTVEELIPVFLGLRGE
jgi:DNA-binding transcriptional MerR regulator